MMLPRKRGALIVLLLKDGVERSGLEIERELASRYPSKEGPKTKSGIYRVLGGLRLRGYVRIARIEPTGRNYLKFYGLTKGGRQAAAALEERSHRRFKPAAPKKPIPEQFRPHLLRRAAERSRRS